MKAVMFAGLLLGFILGFLGGWYATYCYMKVQQLKRKIGANQEKRAQVR